MENKYQEAKNILKKYNQQHLLYYYDSLNEQEKYQLLENILNIDFKDVKIMLDKIINHNESKQFKDDIQPIQSVKSEDYLYEDYIRIFDIGKKIIQDEKYAIITMAGGQGTRLGHDGPKGTYSLTLKKGNKYIFEIFVENLLKIYNKYNVYIPWYIMTSQANNDETMGFFESNNYFNYPKECVKFFKQGELPITTINGDLVLESKNKVFMASDGNGGVFNALAKNKIIDELKSNNIEWLLITGVDNILANLADEFYIGLVEKEGKLNGVKSVEKLYPEEKVGVFCKRNGKPSVIEYSEMGEQMLHEEDYTGKLKYADANIVNHILNIKILDNIKNQKLPIHKAIKKLNYIDKNGDYIMSNEPNMLKYETFIFDYFNMVEDTTVYRVKRENEFAPIKNKEGVDSPETATKLYNEYWFGGNI